ncbi:sensor histidine kinase, partial [Methylobacterium trifolii]
AGPLLAPLPAEHEGSRVAVAVDLPEPALHGDRDLIYQAVSNLVSNAVKYSPRPAEVSVTVSRSDLLDGAVIAVADRGIGIPGEEVDQVFEPYYRARNSGGIRGIGIGLHLVRHFAEAHGGTVRIEARPGGGTIVRLHLPADGGGA